MTAIIAFFLEHSKSFLIGFATIIGCFFVAKGEKLKVENQILSDSIEDENKTIEKQNEVMEALSKAAPLDISGITDRMRDDKL